MMWMHPMDEKKRHVVGRDSAAQPQWLLVPVSSQEVNTSNTMDPVGFLKETDEMLQENFNFLAKENEKRIREAHQHQDLFRSRTVAEFIFLMADELGLTDQATFQAVELYTEFMRRHIEDLRDIIHKSNVSTTAKQSKWQIILKHVGEQVQLRAVSCCQLAAKFSSRSCQVTLIRVRQVLQSYGLNYNRHSILRSELRVFSTVGFNVQVWSPHDYLTTILEIMDRNNPRARFPLKSYERISEELLTLFYIKNEDICTRLYEYVTGSALRNISLHKFHADRLLAAVGVIAAAVEIGDPHNTLVVKEELLRITRQAPEDIDDFKNALLWEVKNDSSPPDIANNSFPAQAENSRQEWANQPEGVRYHPYRPGPSSPSSANQPGRARHPSAHSNQHQPRPASSAVSQPRKADSRSFNIRDIMSSGNEQQPRPTAGSRSFNIRDIMSSGNEQQPRPTAGLRSFNIRDIIGRRNLWEISRGEKTEELVGNIKKTENGGTCGKYQEDGKLRNLAVGNIKRTEELVGNIKRMEELVGNIKRRENGGTCGKYQEERKRRNLWEISRGRRNLWEISRGRRNLWEISRGRRNLWEISRGRRNLWEISRGEKTEKLVGNIKRTEELVGNIKRTEELVGNIKRTEALVGNIKRTEALVGNIKRMD
ncbi:hypothetical protein ACOMHN_030941 [Nucella lapillus]